MKEKYVNGLNLAFLLRSVIASVVGFVMLFLPYVSKDGTTKSMFTLAGALASAADTSGATFVLYVTCALSVAVFAVAVISYFKTSLGLAKVWQVLTALQCVGYTILMFASKSIIETAGIASKVMVKDLSFGYWLGLVAAYVALVLIMRMTHTNVGYIVLSILGVIWLFPILWIVLTAFREEGGYYVGYFIPHGFTFQNFIDLFTHENVLPFGRWWVNTVIVAACSCVINTLIVLMTSFTLSRTRFSGRKNFMKILMIIGMFPGFMSLLAVYNILKGLGLNQSLLALIVVGAAGAAMGYHISKGFFDTIPKAVDEAAIIDGASRFQIFTQVTLPLSKSIIVYTVLGNFLGAWSDYIFPSILFGDKQKSYTVAVGLYWMTDFRRIDSYYTQFAAGAIVVAVPIVILFIWLQKYYVEGLSGAVKG